MLLAATIAILVPRFIYKPSMDFVGATGDIYYIQQKYKVVDGKLTEQQTVSVPAKPTSQISATDQPTEILPTTDTIFYRFNVQAGTFAEITLSDVKTLKLDPSLQSSDGFTVSSWSSYDTTGNPLFGFSGPAYGVIYLSGHGTSEKFTMPADSNRPYVGFQFIGWIQ